MTEAHDDLYLDAGKIIVFSSGSYSDYGYHGMYVTLQPLLRSRLIDLADETTAEHKRLDAEHDVAIEKWTKASGDPYPAMPGIHELWETTLIKAGLLMIVDYREMHVGDYSELSIVT